jgi:Rv2525c-like, glycoside hydrolase-like domain
MLITLLWFVVAAGPENTSEPTYLGLDRNQYPGDDHLAALRKTFRFTSYWLSNPPGENSNTWKGRRALLRSHGFGFLVLFNGRKYKQLKAPADAAALGNSDADAAIKAAAAEGFPLRTVIFFDQEEGGRLLPEQRAYLHAWVDFVNQAGYRAGVYCSGLSFKESGGETVITGEDIRQHAGNREIVYWIANDACPPAPGCALGAPQPRSSGLPFASVWQFAQSPRRAQFASGCGNYHPDGNCYAPGSTIFVDLDSADSPDPSSGR